MTSKAISHRLTLSRDQNWKCHYCLRPMVTKTGRSETATVDHKTPLARGGGWGAHNLVACCWRCNNVKSSLTETEVSEVGTKAVMLEAARAAIASMREPTGNVDCAGCMVIFKKRFEPVSVVEISTPAWQAMIDEILK